MVTTTRELLQMALDEMTRNIPNMECHLDSYFEMMNAIRAHLAKPEPEPVAWKVTYNLADTAYDKLPKVFQFEPVGVRPGTSVVPLYTKEQL